MHAWSVLVYKVGLAAGDHQKPVWILANDVSNPSQHELWMAEGIANGGLAVMSGVDQSVPYNSSQGFSQANRRYSQFVTKPANRFLFVDRQSAAEVAVIVSLPSLLWRDFSSLTVPYATGYNESHMNYYSVVARALSDRHCPFDIIILGYPRENLFNETAQLSRLRSGQYTTVVLPWVDALSDAHIMALKAFASGSGNRRLVVVNPEQTATFDEELLPRAVTGAAKVFAGVSFTSVSHELIKTYYQNSNQTAGDAMFTSITGGSTGPKQPVILENTSSETWIGNLWSHGGEGPGMRSVTLVNYNLTLSGPTWYSLRGRPANESIPICGMCGSFYPSVDLRVSVRCPSQNCEDWLLSSANYFAMELHSSVKLKLDFSYRAGYATCIVPFVHTLGVLAVGPGKGEVGARAAAADLRRWVNRAVKQVDNVAKAGVADALRALLQIHGRDAPVPAGRDYSLLAAQLGAMAQAMKQHVTERTVRLESEATATKHEARAQKAVYKLDVGAMGSTSSIPGFEPFRANSSDVKFSFSWVGAKSYVGRSGANKSYIKQSDCSATSRDALWLQAGATEMDPLFQTALWSDRPAVLRLAVPEPGEYTVAMWVGSCGSDQGGAFTAQSWQGLYQAINRTADSYYMYQDGQQLMTPKVTITSVAMVTAGANGLTLSPVLFGDRTFAGYYAPHAFTVNISKSIDLRLSGSTGTSFLNHIAWCAA